MKTIKTKFEDLLVIEPKVWEDKRGYFYESYQKERYQQIGINIEFIQDNEAKSNYGVIRGLHYQLPPHGQSKLVKVTLGEVLDVVVDIRPWSATYGKHFSLILNDITKKQLFIPAGFAHGYAVLSDEAIFSYKCDKIYHPQSESGINLTDRALNINWIVPEQDMVISEKDIQLPGWRSHLPWPQNV